MEYAMFVVNLGVVVAAIWYSIETRKLRLQNLTEIRLLSNQGRLTLAPFLVPGAQKLSKEQLEELIDADDDATDEEKSKRKAGARKTEVFFAVQVDNPTADKVGCHLEPYIYDPSTKSFLIPDHGKEWISPKETEMFQVTGPYVTRPRVEEEIKEHFGNVVVPLLAELETPEDHGYVALFFQDVEGTVYLSKRPFTIAKSGEVRHRPTRLSCAAIHAG